MGTARRSFLKLSGSAAAAAMLAGCGSSGTSGSSQNGPSTPSVPPKDPGTLALQAFLNQHASAGLVLPLAAAPFPGIAWAGPLTSSPVVATTLAGSNVIPVTSHLVVRPAPSQWQTDVPGNPVIDGHPCLRISRAYSCAGVARTVNSPNIFHIRTDAPVIEIAGVSPEGSSSSQTLRVDGRLLSPVVLSSGWGNGGGWTFGSARVDFGSRAVRDIWIETGMHAAYFKIGQDDQMLAPETASEPQITFIGDSYLQSNSAAFSNGAAIGLEVAARLGFGKVTIDAIGGTGYRNSGYGLGNLSDRVLAHAADGSQIFVVLAGLNDYADVTGNGQLQWPAGVDYENGIRNYFAALRSACPTAVIVATAPFCPVPPMSDASYVASTITNQSGLGDFLYKASVQKRALQSITGPWIYIDVLMGSGWLNSSGASGDVTGLQWLTGGKAAPGTTANYKPGNTQGGGGGGGGGIIAVPIVAGGVYSQAPEVRASGGSGNGLLLASTIDRSGTLHSIRVLSPGSGYTAGAGLPSIQIDASFQLQPAMTGTPQLSIGINADGQYPLSSFAPSGVGDLNNIFRYLSSDMVHPSPLGVEYLSSRLARNIHDAILAL